MLSFPDKCYWFLQYSSSLTQSVSILLKGSVLISLAAWLQDTIMTTPHDIAILIICCHFNGKQAESRFASKGSMWVGLSSDDLADAYHVVPNLPSQLNRCIVVIRSPHPGKT